MYIYIRICIHIYVYIYISTSDALTNTPIDAHINKHNYHTYPTYLYNVRACATVRMCAVSRTCISIRIYTQTHTASHRVFLFSYVNRIKYTSTDTPPRIFCRSTANDPWYHTSAWTVSLNSCEKFLQDGVFVEYRVLCNRKHHLDSNRKHNLDRYIQPWKSFQFFAFLFSWVRTPANLKMARDSFGALHLTITRLIATR